MFQIFACGKNVTNQQKIITRNSHGFRQCKQELGWTDYRLTDFKDIEKWWEIIFDVYTMISLNSPAFLALNKSRLPTNVKESNSVNFSNHQEWNF